MELIENGRETVVIRLDRDEIGALNNALNEILNGPTAITEWEFHARIGVTRDAAESLLDAIHALPG
jgi:hypothetical protein